MLILVEGTIRADAVQVRRLVSHAFHGIDPAGVEVRVERMRSARQSFTGLAYPEPPPRRVQPGTEFLVRLFLPGVLRNRGYPRTYRYRGRVTAPWITVADWRERFIALAAHEARHVHQFRHGLRRSEVDAERWATAALDRWREAGEAPTDGSGGSAGRGRHGSH